MVSFVFVELFLDLYQSLSSTHKRSRTHLSIYNLPTSPTSFDEVCGDMGTSVVLPHATWMDYGLLVYHVKIVTPSLDNQSILQHLFAGHFMYTIIQCGF